MRPSFSSTCMAAVMRGTKNDGCYDDENNDRRWYGLEMIDDDDAYDCEKHRKQCDGTFGRQRLGVSHDGTENDTHSQQPQRGFTTYLADAHVHDLADAQHVAHVGHVLAGGRHLRLEKNQARAKGQHGSGIIREKAFGAL